MSTLCKCGKEFRWEEDLVRHRRTCSWLAPYEREAITTSPQPIKVSPAAPSVAAVNVCECGHAVTTHDEYGCLDTACSCTHWRPAVNQAAGRDTVQTDLASMVTSQRSEIDTLKEDAELNRDTIDYWRNGAEQEAQRAAQAEAERDALAMKLEAARAALADTIRDARANADERDAHRDMLEQVWSMIGHYPLRDGKPQSVEAPVVHKLWAYLWEGKGTVK